MACGGQSYRQCFSDIIKAHGHKGLYNGFVSGLVRSSLCSYIIVSAGCVPWPACAMQLALPCTSNTSQGTPGRN